MPKRKESTWSLNQTAYPGERTHADVTLTFTRKGIEVLGYFDGMVGIGPTTLITWERLNDDGN